MSAPDPTTGSPNVILSDRFVIGCLTVVVLAVIGALVYLDAIGEHASAQTYTSYIVRAIVALAPMLVTIRIGQSLAKGTKTVNDNASAAVIVAERTATDTQQLLNGRMDAKIEAGAANAVRAVLLEHGVIQPVEDDPKV